MKIEWPSVYEKNKELINLTPKQNLIFRSAIHLFATKGFATTSTQEIANLAQVSEGTLFKKFNNKNQLLSMIIKPLAIELLPKDPLNLVKSDPINLSDFVFSFVNNRVNFINRNILSIKILIKEITYNQTLTDKFLSWVPKERINEFNYLLSILKEQKEIVNWPDSEIMRFLLSEMTGYVIHHYFFRCDKEWKDSEEINRIINFTIKGLTPEA